MTGASQQGDRQKRRGQRHVVLLLWLAAALSLLQWTAPTVDPWQFARLSAGTPHEAGLALADRLSPAIETGTTVNVGLEKRSAGGRSLPTAEDGAATADGIALPGTSGRHAIGASAPVQGPWPPAGDRFTARSPPQPA